MSRNLKVFFDGVRDSVFGGSMSQEQVDGCIKTIEYRDERFPKMPDAELAYVLSTFEWECAHTMRPVQEGYPLTGAALKAYQKKLRYYPWHGRGPPMLTWEDNYKKFGCADNPDKMLEWDFGLHVLFEGMIYGKFASDSKGPHKLSRYISATRQDYVGARRIINGTDKAEHIAKNAREFHAALLKAADAFVASKPPMPAPEPTTAPKPAPAPVPAPAGPTWSDRLKDFLDKLGTQPPARAPLPPPAPITWQVPIPAPTATPSPDLLSVANRIEERQIKMLELLKALAADMAAQKDVLDMVKAHVVDLRTQLVAKDAEVAAAVGTMTPEQQAEFDAIKAQLAANTQIANEAANA